MKLQTFKFDPWHSMRGLSELQNEMGNLLETWATPSKSLAREFQAACDLEETDTHYILSFDLPGVRENDLNIELNKNELTVSGERRYEKCDSERHFTERSYGRFARSFTLPSTIDPEKIEAHFNHGVLTVSLAKVEAAKPKKIEVKAGEPAMKSEKIISVNPQPKKSA